MAAVPGLLRQWNPGIVQGLNAWYDPSDPRSVQTTGGLQIGTLRDKSGLSNHLTQAVQANQPIAGSFINGVSSINFSGSNIFLSTMTSVLPATFNTASYTHFMIAQVRSNTTQGNLYLLNNSNNSIYSGLIHQTGQFSMINTNAAQKSIAAVPPTTLIVENYYDRVGGNIFIASPLSNAQASGIATPAFSNLSMYALGTSRGTQIAGTSIGEVIMYSNYYANTTATNQQIEGYLAWKWGLQSHLSNGHPYKRRQPT